MIYSNSLNFGDSLFLQLSHWADVGNLGVVRQTSKRVDPKLGMEQVQTRKNSKVGGNCATDIVGDSIKL